MVDRFDMTTKPYQEGFLPERMDDGDWVRYEDYDALASKLAAAEKERGEIAEALHYANGTAELAMKHRDEAESRLSSCQKVAREAWDYMRELHNEVGPRFPGARVCDLLATELGQTTEQLAAVETEMNCGRCRELEHRLGTLKTECERMRKALDAIYNHNEAARAAVIEHYGLRHHPAAVERPCCPVCGSTEHLTHPSE